MSTTWTLVGSAWKWTRLKFTIILYRGKCAQKWFVYSLTKIFSETLAPPVARTSSNICRRKQKSKNYSAICFFPAAVAPNPFSKSPQKKLGKAFSKITWFHAWSDSHNLNFGGLFLCLQQISCNKWRGNQSQKLDNPSVFSVLDIESLVGFICVQNKLSMPD